MTIDQVQMSPERWRQFWDSFKGEPQQVAGIEELRQAILQADPTLLTEGASWVANFHKEQPKPAGLITKEQLAEVMGCLPRYIPDELMDDLAHCCQDFCINTPLRLAYFLGQCGEESGGLRYPLEIASGSAYEWRSDLGNNHAGDGVKFAGTGWIQVTGRHNHQKFNDYMARIGKADPKIMEVGKTYTCNRYPWSISGFWWLSNGMNGLCDERPDVDQVGRRVNGQMPPRGAAERRAYTQKAMRVLGVY